MVQGSRVKIAGSVFSQTPFLMIQGDEMKQKMKLGRLAITLCLTLLSAPLTATADEVPMITGDHWVKSSEDLKKVYLIGVANLAQIEVAYHASNPPPDTQSLVPRFGKGLKGHTLDSVRDGLNHWYASHPEQLQRPVIETIWFEMVVPGLQQIK
jgi:hypothetical protein